MRRIPAIALASALGLLLVVGGLALQSPKAAAQAGNPLLHGILTAVVRTVDGLAGSLLRNGPWTVTVPQGAFHGKTQVTLTRVQGRMPTLSLELADPSLNSFSKPVTLTYRANNPYEVVGKTLYCWNVQDLRWEEVAGATTNPATGEISAPLQHFSLYAVGGKAGW